VAVTTHGGLLYLRISVRLLAAVLTLASAGLARADVIFTNGALSSVDGNEMSGWIQANAFTLHDTSRITGVSFYALALTQAVYNGSIDWSFYADESGTPGELLVTGLQSVTAVDAGPAVSLW